MYSQIPSCLVTHLSFKKEYFQKHISLLLDLSRPCRCRWHPSPLVWLLSSSQPIRWPRLKESPSPLRPPSYRCVECRLPRWEHAPVSRDWERVVMAQPPSSDFNKNDPTTHFGIDIILWIHQWADVILFVQMAQTARLCSSHPTLLNALCWQFLKLASIFSEYVLLIGKVLFFLSWLSVPGLNDWLHCPTLRSWFLAVLLTVVHLHQPLFFTEMGGLCRLLKLVSGQLVMSLLVSEWRVLAHRNAAHVLIGFQWLLRAAGL